MKKTITILFVLSLFFNIFLISGMIRTNNSEKSYQIDYEKSFGFIEFSKKNLSQSLDDPSSRKLLLYNSFTDLSEARRFLEIYKPYFIKNKINVQSLELHLQGLYDKVNNLVINSSILEKEINENQIIEVLEELELITNLLPQKYTTLKKVKAAFNLL
ncbi:hypothetical protein AB4Z45_32825 [Paenibacillus sp. MCAF9]|uniref:hypothetical protein n=1 Tax=Paenibacillus sp. MCAF9 TaxID=3233046 RepID=UPI003F9E9B3D